MLINAINYIDKSCPFWASSTSTEANGTVAIDCHRNQFWPFSVGISAALKTCYKEGEYLCLPFTDEQTEAQSHDYACGSGRQCSRARIRPRYQSLDHPVEKEPVSC